ncbi:hypothetical protein [Legionella sp. WA2024007413]
MIYITIPPGMVFKRVTLEKNDLNGVEKLSDCFANQETIIDL